MAREVERKFVVDDVPGEVALGEGDALRQGYLAGEGDVEVRVRIAGAGATLTVKGGSGLSRAEVELPVPAGEVEELWALTATRRLEKVRHRVALRDGLVAEVDVYDGDLAGLRTVEVEFADEAAAVAFAPPAWFGREVTGEEGWRNAALARHGVP